MEPYTPEQVNYLATYLSKTFITRKDVKAEALPTRGGGYRPLNERWKMGDLKAHVRGEKTFGHYLLDQDSMVKFVAFDIDLEKEGTYCDFSFENQERMMEAGADPIDWFDFIDCDPREVWLDRGHVGRTWLKYQMRILAEVFERCLSKLGLKTFSSYSGSKGIHVYGIFPGPIQASDARIFANKVLDRVANMPPLAGNAEIVSSKGKNFYYIKPVPDKDVHMLDRYENFSIEVFPKQDKIEPNRFGNLMRLEFGKNMKAPKEPTFIIDTSKALITLAPHDTFEQLQNTLENGNQW